MHAARTLVVTHPGICFDRIMLRAGLCRTCSVRIHSIENPRSRDSGTSLSPRESHPSEISVGSGRTPTTPRVPSEANWARRTTGGMRLGPSRSEGPRVCSRARPVSAACQCAPLRACLGDRPARGGPAVRVTPWSTGAREPSEAVEHDTARPQRGLRTPFGARALRLRGWRNTVGNLIGLFWLNKNIPRASIYWYMHEHEMGTLSSNSRFQVSRYSGKPLTDWSGVEKFDAGTARGRCARTEERE